MSSERQPFLPYADEMSDGQNSGNDESEFHSPTRVRGYFPPQAARDEDIGDIVADLEEDVPPYGRPFIRRSVSTVIRESREQLARDLEQQQTRNVGRHPFAGVECSAPPTSTPIRPFRSARSSLQSLSTRSDAQRAGPRNSTRSQESNMISTAPRQQQTRPSSLQWSSPEVQQRQTSYQSELVRLQRQLRLYENRRATELQQVALALHRVEEQQHNQMRVQQRLMDAFTTLDLQQREARRAAASSDGPRKQADLLRSGDENEKPQATSQTSTSAAAQHAHAMQSADTMQASRAAASSQPQPDASMLDNTNTDRARQDSGARSSISLPSRKSSKLGSIDEVASAPAPVDAATAKVFAQGTVFACREELDECLRAEGLKHMKSITDELIVYKEDRYYMVLNQGKLRGLVVQYEHNTIRKGLTAVIEDKKSYDALPRAARALVRTERPEEYFYSPGTGLLRTFRGPRVNEFFFNDGSDADDSDDELSPVSPKSNATQRLPPSSANDGTKRSIAGKMKNALRPKLAGSGMRAKPGSSSKLPHLEDIEPSGNLGRQSQVRPPATPGYVDSETGIDTGMTKKDYEEYLRMKAEDESDA